MSSKYSVEDFHTELLDMIQEYLCMRYKTEELNQEIEDESFNIYTSIVDNLEKSLNKEIIKKK